MVWIVYLILDAIHLLTSLTVAHQDVLKEVEVEYITMPGWKSNTEQLRNFEDLPPNAQAYVLKLEELVGVPGKLIQQC